MKKILFIIVLMLFVSVCAYSETCNTSDAYEYPILPGTKEWKELSGYPEKIEVSQIPENQLKAMSTEGLLETVLNCPVIINIIAFAPYQKGYISIFNQFNGLQELSNREDLDQIILNKYYELNNTIIPENKSLRVKFNGKIVGIEMIISQDYIIDNLNDEQKIFLLRETIKRYESTNDSLGYSVAFKNSIFRVIDNILLSLKYKPYIKLLSLEKNRNLRHLVKQFGYSFQKIRNILIIQARNCIIELNSEGSYYEE